MERQRFGVVVVAGNALVGVDAQEYHINESFFFL